MEMELGSGVKAANVVCPHCHQPNRLADEAIEGARCSACDQPLFDGHPAALSAASFEAHLTKSDLPLVVDFWAPWCGPCRVMAPAFERAAAELEPEFRLAKVNTDEEPALAMRHHIRSIPTLVIFNQGAEVARVSGVMDAGRLAAWVRANA
jgi:thioredoxin 2